MELLNVVLKDTGALLVGAMWGIYIVAQQVMGNMRSSKRQDSVDSGNAALVDSLQKAMEDAARISSEERDRADRHARTVNDLMVELGTLRAELRHVNLYLEERKAEVLLLRASVEELVSEIRNKDKTIELVTDTNKKILKSITASKDASTATDTPQE